MTTPLTPERSALAERFVPMGERTARTYCREHPSADADAVLSAAMEGTVRAAGGFEPAKMPSGPRSYFSYRIGMTIKDQVERKGELGDTRKLRRLAHVPTFSRFSEPAGAGVQDMAADGADGEYVAPTALSLCQAAAALRVHPEALLRAIDEVNGMGRPVAGVVRFAVAADLLGLRPAGFRRARWFIEPAALQELGKLPGLRCCRTGGRLDALRLADSTARQTLDG